MLDKLKTNCSWYAYYSIAMVFSITFAGLGLYVLRLEARRSAAYKYLNDFTVESWNAMTNSPHQHATVMDVVITASIALAGTAIMISPILGSWALVNWLDSHGSQNSQVERDSEDARNEKG